MKRARNIFSVSGGIEGIILMADGVLFPAEARLAGQSLMPCRFDVFGLQVAHAAGFKIALIASPGLQVAGRLMESIELQILDLGDQPPLAVAERYAAETGNSLGRYLALGADVPEIPLLRAAGVSLCPFDATSQAKEEALHVTRRKSGRGAAREAIEMVMRNQDRWDEACKAALEGVATGD